jgi:hypothetical protein
MKGIAVGGCDGKQIKAALLLSEAAQSPLLSFSEGSIFFLVTW